MKRKYKKLQMDKYGRVLCAVLLTVYFIFALTQSNAFKGEMFNACLLYTSPSPRD